MEIWSPVPVAPKYSISNFGRFKNSSGKMLVLNNNGNGYMQISIRVMGKKRNLYIHRLVALAFIENPSNKPRVNHKDGNKANNHFLNLEWSTAKENTHHAMNTGLITGMSSRSDYNPIIDLQTGIFYDSVLEAAKSRHIIWQTLYSWLNKPHRNKSSLKYAL